MRTRFLMLRAGILVLIALLLPLTVFATVGGAGFTTFDVVQQGCLDSPNGVDCNNYTAKNKVYMSGGPTAAGLTDGCYYFSVLVPGFQNGGFIFGAVGNLSDTVVPAGATPGDVGGGDSNGRRTFRVTNHLITYPDTTCDPASGGHATGVQPNTGKLIIQLSPYDDTSNAGGVYILAICRKGATSPSQCKYDAFRVAPIPPPDTVIACKYYDTNVDGAFDGLDFPLSGWPMTISPVDGAAEPMTQATDSQGCVTWTNLSDGTYTVTESAPVQLNWFNSDPGPNGTPLVAPTGPSQQVAVAGGEKAMLDFGNFCEVPSGGLTLGYWSNKNGQGLITAADLCALTGDPLVDGSGNQFNPVPAASCPGSVTAAQLSNGKTALKNWLLSGKATNMAYMLGVQMTATELDVRHGFVDGNAFDLCSGMTINALIADASALLAAAGGNLTLAGSPLRALEEADKNCLDAINNGALVVPSTACTYTFQ